jgi:hypothetical protein
MQSEKFAANTDKNIECKKMYPADRRIPNDQSSITHAGFGLLNGCCLLYQSFISKKTVSEKQRWSFIFARLIKSIIQLLRLS